MNCRELVERATDYLEDALGTQDQARLDEHVRDCRGCRTHLGQVNRTLRLVSSLPAEPLPNQLEATLLAHYREWAKSA
jgi:predicted anti-sigma-YlaC factor YlaD